MNIFLNRFFLGDNYLLLILLLYVFIKDLLLLVSFICLYFIFDSKYVDLLDVLGYNIFDVILELKELKKS